MTDLLIEFSQKNQLLFSKKVDQRPRKALSSYREGIKFKPNLISLNKPNISAGASGVEPTLDKAKTTDDLVPLLSNNIETLEPLTTVIQNRASSRIYKGEGIDLNTISSLFNFACGKRNQEGKRRYPSGGGLYPVNIYLSLNQLAVNNQGLNKGNYRFDAELSCLHKISQKSVFELSQFSQVFVPNAAGVIFLAFDLAKLSPKYGELGYKLALLEAGHIAQNILLVMETLGLNGIPLQFYYEDIVNNLLSLSGQDQSVCYAIEFGIKPQNLKGVS